MDVPEVVIQRIPLYVRLLNQFQAKGISVASSRQIGSALGITSAQIRKDLGYFGHFGTQGKGYDCALLLRELRKILQIDKEWGVALVGVGRLGRAIIGYPGFAPEGFKITAAFDVDARQVGKAIGGILVQPISELRRTLKTKDIRIAVVAVPTNEAPDVIENLKECGIRAILNYSSVSPKVPNEVKVRNIDPILALQSMTYYLK